MTTAESENMNATLQGTVLEYLSCLAHFALSLLFLQIYHIVSHITWAKIGIFGRNGIQKSPFGIPTPMF